jgi:hypothetical protein
MKSLKWLGLVAGLHAMASWSQDTPLGSHDGHARAARKTDAIAPSAKAALARPAGYESPFADYRRFVADEPLKDWRAANDEVREAGGHMGLVKPASPAAHDEHLPHKGAKP